MPTCAVLSFRLGGTDGVSVVAATWIDALRATGFDVVTVAGEGPVDRRVPDLAIGRWPDGRPVWWARVRPRPTSSRRWSGRSGPRWPTPIWWWSRTWAPSR